MRQLGNEGSSKSALRDLCKQMSFYLGHELLASVRAAKERSQLNNRDIVANCVNRWLRARGEDPIFVVSGLPIKYRNRGLARPGSARSLTPSRQGKTRMAVWHLKNEVNQFADYCDSIDLNMENAIHTCFKGSFG